MILLVVAVGVGLSACGGDDDRAADVAAGAEFDRAFIDAMVPHHESALEMARSAKAAGLTEPELAQVADDVLAAQQAEIDQMKAWRGEWFGSSDIDPEGAAALGMSDEQMGMAHDADDLLNSGDVDSDFATMMIDHHQGAIEMAELALERAEHDELKELAEAIIDAQQREIEVLEPHAGEMMDHG
ncbi:MAG TPA: DUF305 domain-containing protein [Gaiellaceae bacterium]|nr:DUF305 domain-containing protein [Gaiellaceae bacterium]